MKYWQRILMNEMEARKSKESSSSLREFAAFIGTSPAQLSQLLSGKRPLTRKTAEKICRVLNLGGIEKERFFLSIHADEISETADHIQLASDEFALISDWHHFAILSLAETKNAKASSLWVSKRLGIDHFHAKEAMERLERMGILEIKNGKMRQAKKNLRTSSDVPSSAIRKYHRQNLKLAAEKIETVPVELREYTSITMAIDPKNIPEAKKAINEFKRKLCALLEKGEAEEVYTFSAQLFPVSLTKETK